MVEQLNWRGPVGRSWSLWLMVAGVACSATPDGGGTDGPEAQGTGGMANATGGLGETGGLGATGAAPGSGGIGATGGDAATGGLAATGGGPAAGGTSGTGGEAASGGAGTGGGAVDDNACGNGVANEAHVPEMVGAVCETSNIPNCNITDFTAATFAADGTWGDEMSLTGGSFDYKDEASTLTWDVSDDQLNLTASIVADGYVGIGLWFGPCTDATDFDGIQITLAGDLGGATLELQVNSDENYPIEERDNFGSCAHAEGEEWNECTNNTTVLSPVAATATTFTIPWADFTGGTPVATLSPNQLGGLQLQVGCAEDVAPCETNLEIYDIRFHRPGVGVGDAEN